MFFINQLILYSHKLYETETLVLLLVQRRKLRRNVSKVTQVEQNLNPGLLVPSLYRLEYGEEKASVSLSQLHPLTYGIRSFWPWEGGSVHDSERQGQRISHSLLL